MGTQRTGTVALRRAGSSQASYVYIIQCLRTRAVSFGTYVGQIASRDFFHQVPQQNVSLVELASMPAHLVQAAARIAPLESILRQQAIMKSATALGAKQASTRQGLAHHLRLHAWIAARANI